MNIAHDYNEIPNNIKEQFSNANPFYQESEFEHFNNSGNPIVYLYDDNFIMPVVNWKKLIFNRGYLPSEPFCYKEGGDYDRFVQVACEGIHKILGLDWIMQTPPSALFMSAPRNSLSIPFGSHVINLNQTEEELWAKVHSKHRNVIRNAQKHGVKVKVGGIELLDDYMIAEADTQRRSKLPVGAKSKYEDLFNEFKDHVLVFVACLDLQVQGGAIIVYSNPMAYYMFGASVNSPLTGAMNLVQWEAIKYLKKLGISSYSFVGCRINEDENSKYHGIQNFKKRFGGELVEGKMFKVIYKPFKYKLYKLLIALKTRGRFQNDIIDQEIHKWIQK